MKKTDPISILITGGAGFIGSHLADFWVKNGAVVTIIDNLSTGNSEWIPSGIEFIKCDLNKTAQIHKIISIHKPKFIYHVAGHTKIREALLDPAEDAKDNLGSTISLIQACMNEQRVSGYIPSQIIFSSTSAVYAGSKLPPFSEHSKLAANTPYGIAKSAAESYFKWYQDESGVPVTILRYANVYGPRQSVSGEAGVVAKFMNAVSDGETLTIYGDGSHARDYIHVSDVVAANVAVTKHNKSGIFVVGTGIPTTTKELALMCSRLVRNTAVEYQSVDFDEQVRSYLHSEKLFTETGWKSKISLKDGLKTTLQWYKNRKQ